MELWFSYLPVTFLIPLVVIFLFPSPPPRYTSPLSDLWVLLLSRVLKESFSYWTGPIFCHLCPAVSPKKGATCWLCSMEKAVSYSTQCTVGASLHCQPLWRLRDCYRENMLSFLLSTACRFLSFAPARTLHSSPSKFFSFHLLAMSCGAFFAGEKVIGK